MAIPSADLKLRSGDTGFVMSQGSLQMTKRWEVYHATLGDVIATGSGSQFVPTISSFPAADDKLEVQAGAFLGAVQEMHKAVAAIGGFSAWDANLILDAWMQDEDGLHHPICGDLAATPADLVARVNAILAGRLPPPTWAWARPGGAGEVQVKIVAVPGAASYNVYDGEDLIGNVPNGAWQTIGGLSAGAYSVRTAGFDGAEVGILSFAIGVEVA